MSEQKPPFGPWATLGIALLIGGLFALIQTAVAAALIIAGGQAGTEAEFIKAVDALPYNGDFLPWATFAAAPLCTAAVIAAARWRATDWRGYLAFKPAYVSPWMRWMLVIIVFGAICDTLTLAQGRPVVTEFARVAYSSATFKPLLWLAFVLVAPLFEEIFFRGFVFKGLEHSRLGGRGAVFVTALFFAMLHVQYDLWGMLQVFGGGMIFGYARWRTGSLYVTISMHVWMNLVATLQAALF
jgi:membrane protease YdiL (CAAX protease family)